jgi:HTH-type transcriptional regulator/antitoxin HipB
MRIRSIRDVAASVKGRRQELGLSQAELARRAGVSRKWVYEFEAGKPAAELGLVLRVLEPLGLTLEVTRLPDDAAHGELDRLLGRLADRRQ